MKRRNFIKAAGGLLAALLPVGLLAKKEYEDITNLDEYAASDEKWSLVDRAGGVWEYTSTEPFCGTFTITGTLHYNGTYTVLSE